MFQAVSSVLLQEGRDITFWPQALSRLCRVKRVNFVYNPRARFYVGWRLESLNLELEKT